jgi:processive 1,2-diacylglycerol beta-glucosyltransferase
VKKVVIFTCVGGHTTVSRALHESFCNDYKVTVFNIFTDVLYGIDPIRWLTLNCFNAEDLYAWVLRNRWYNFANKNWRRGYKFYELMYGFVYKIIKKKLIHEKPDCIVSVIPFFNNYFASIAAELNVPFILMPTDLDLTTFLHNIDQHFAYDKAHIALQFDDPKLLAQLDNVAINESRIHIAGVAINRQFFSSHNVATIKLQFNIPTHKPVILLLMGSQGSTSMYDFVMALANIQDVEMHLIIVLGANVGQRCTIENIKFGSNITHTIFAYTPYIAQLMVISDLVVTKSGGISVAEGLYSCVPMILDATIPVLCWEQENQRFIERNEFGICLRSLKDLPVIVRRLLTVDQHMLTKYSANMQRYLKLNGAQEMVQLLKKII